MNAYAEEMGFKDQAEMIRLVASVPEESYAAFYLWRERDGTKVGLLKLLREVR